MTSATMKRAALEREGYGLALFASVMLLILGCFNLIYGIAAVANAHVFIGQRTLPIRHLELLGLGHAVHRRPAAPRSGRGHGGQPARKIFN
jgi:hypothetical protein